MRAYVDLHELRMSIEGIGKPKPVDARNASQSVRPKPYVRPKLKPALPPTPTDPASGAATCRVRPR